MNSDLRIKIYKDEIGMKSDKYFNAGVLENRKMIIKCQRICKIDYLKLKMNYFWGRILIPILMETI